MAGAVASSWTARPPTDVAPVSLHCLLVGWKAVPAAIYFVRVVRNLSLGTMADWNLGAEGARLHLA